MSGTGSFENYEKRQTNEPALLAFMNPLDNNDRVRAMRAEFTSVARDCPFYDERVRSRCLVDPHVIYLPDCTGRSFAHGICCPKILQSSVEVRLK